MNKIWTLLLLGMAFTSCSVNKDLMLKTDKDFEFDVVDMTPNDEYHISPNDVLRFRLFTNDGFELVEQELMGAGGNNNSFLNQSERVNYLIEQDGYVKLPVVGRVNLSGYTVREAEFYLEEMFVQYYNLPFVQLQVMNRRVIIFPGQGGDAKVVNLQNENTTLLEAIAQAGGISDRGRADRIKVIRESDEGRKIFLIDLSTIEGLQYADMVVQANDIIYIEPVPDVAREITRDLAPILSLLTSALFLYGVVKGFGP